MLINIGKFSNFGKNSKSSGVNFGNFIANFGQIFNIDLSRLFVNF